ncbi:hypothetical protein [Acetobacter estunensis]|uniref:hypothetical protein n=1 Tax=Acetobacter estunensis TaxID=104097 RepID=UPI001C2D0B51|nr:hypothetical protein [Acetobacter estunensis]MBV1837386.1 hypothetical protein [Acetobacter estunensis]
MRGIDFSSLHGLVVTLLGLVLVTLLGVGLRLMVMLTVQQRRERLNRQINERLSTLMGAYRTLGGSFTGDLLVDPTHLRDLRQQAQENGTSLPEDLPSSFERARRIRDAVEGALSDIILLGTEEQVRLAAKAACDLTAGRPVHTRELVVALRDFIRKALDLEAVPSDVLIPDQGPTRPTTGGGANKDKKEGGKGNRGGGAGGGAGGMGGGGGMGMGFGGAAEEHTATSH